MKRILPWLLVVMVLFSGCTKDPVALQEFVLGSHVSITVYHGGGQEAVEGAMELCRSYEKVFSRTDPDSELSRVNRRESTEISDELAEVIGLGLEVGELSGGAFDITVGGITELWDFTAENPHTPDPELIRARLPHVGMDKVKLEGNTVTFSDPETMLDLGGIAKGWISDRLAEYLREQGVDSAIIDLGGNLYCLGCKPDGSRFSVGIQHPLQAKNETIGGLNIANRSVVTSGAYEKSFAEEGKLYHHILDPKTGWPVENGLLSVSLVTDKSVWGDALSTACFAMGLDAGMEMLEKLPGMNAVFIDEDLEIHLTPGLEGEYIYMQE